MGLFFTRLTENEMMSLEKAANYILLLGAKDLVEIELVHMELKETKSFKEHILKCALLGARHHLNKINNVGWLEK